MPVREISLCHRQVNRYRLQRRRCDFLNGIGCQVEALDDGTLTLMLSGVAGGANLDGKPVCQRDVMVLMEVYRQSWLRSLGLRKNTGSARSLYCLERRSSVIVIAEMMQSKLPVNRSGSTHPQAAGLHVKTPHTCSFTIWHDQVNCQILSTHRSSHLGTQRAENLDWKSDLP